MEVWLRGVGEKIGFKLMKLVRRPNSCSTVSFDPIREPLAFSGHSQMTANFTISKQI